MIKQASPSLLPTHSSAGAAASASEPPRGDALALLLSPDGEFVRGIVAEELAKGIDAAWRVAADDAVDTAREQVMGVLMAEGALGAGDVHERRWEGQAGCGLLVGG